MVAHFAGVLCCSGLCRNPDRAAQVAPKIVSGSLGLSLAFYVVANTFAWAGGAATVSEPGYAMTLAGWWQANTVGLPGWEPTWHFLRNGMAGDLFFCLLLLLILDRGFLLGHAPVRATARLA